MNLIEQKAPLPAFNSQNLNFGRELSSELEVISYDMRTSDLYKAIEKSIKAYLEIRSKNADYNSEEHYYMCVAQRIADELEKEAISENFWQVIVGNNYGTFVTHESFYFLNFKFDGLWFTLFVSS